MVKFTLVPLLVAFVVLCPDVHCRSFRKRHREGHLRPHRPVKRAIQDFTFNSGDMIPPWDRQSLEGLQSTLLNMIPPERLPEIQLAVANITAGVANAPWVRDPTFFQKVYENMTATMGDVGEMPGHVGRAIVNLSKAMEGVPPPWTPLIEQAPEYLEPLLANLTASLDSLPPQWGALEDLPEIIGKMIANVTMPLRDVPPPWTPLMEQGPSHLNELIRNLTVSMMSVPLN